ncbi:hypothetical protein [Mucilaginibacter auburnensis]|nr:hypothetical protein [Mucilaginibacter auburnensis]
MRSPLRRTSQRSCHAHRDDDVEELLQKKATDVKPIAIKKIL